MSREKRRFPFTGGSSLLVIFTVLCLTVFALLAFSTVAADKRLADASAEAVRQYYEADASAEAILGQLRAGIIPEGVSKDGDVYAYCCPMSDTQALRVVVYVRGTEYEIKQWKVVATTEWSPKEYIEVWTPEREQ